jgi:hypothetical protein
VTALMPVPDTHRGRGSWLNVVGPRYARQACGISAATIARAIGADNSMVGRWERRSREVPRGTVGEAYCRVVAGLLRHLEVPGEHAWDVPRGLRRPAADEAATVLLWHANGWLVLGDGGNVATSEQRRAS